MLQIIIQGRGGQGAQTAGNLLAMAFFAQGRQVQSFASYGGARRGTPVSSYIRIDERPIRVRCDIERREYSYPLCFPNSSCTYVDVRKTGVMTAPVLGSGACPACTAFVENFIRN